MDAPTAAPSTDAFVAPRQRKELILGGAPAALVLACAVALNCRWAAPTQVVSRVTRLTATTALVAALAIPAALPFDLMLTFQARTHKPGGDELYDRWAPKLRDYYTSLFWTSYVATNLVLPISGYYLASGALSVRARLLDALRSLGLRCVCLAAAAGAAIGLAFATGAVSNADGLFSIEAGLASLSNATALVQIIALLGVGLVVLPVSVGAAMSVDVAGAHSGGDWACAIDSAAVRVRAGDARSACIESTPTALPLAAPFALERSSCHSTAWRSMQTAYMHNNRVALHVWHATCTYTGYTRGGTAQSFVQT